MTVLAFRKHMDIQPSPFEFVESMNLDEKRALCEGLLEEFGVRNLRCDAGRQELIHSCLLPFGLHAHGDMNPSASINYKRLTYRCLGCDSKGGLLWFIATCRSTTTDDARSWLEGHTGIGGADGMTLQALLAFFDQIYDKKREVPAPIPHMDARVLTPWLAVHPYLTEMRGITVETIMANQVGWNPDTNRIVIPHFWKGDLVGWQTRRLTDDGTPKYLSSPDMPKDTTLYNHKPKHRYAVVVESPMSVLALAPHVHAVATFGAGVTDGQVRLLAQYGTVTLWMDNDQAGWKATERLRDALEAYCAVQVVENPWAADPADFVAAGRHQEAMVLIDSSVPSPIWRRPATLDEWNPTQEATA